MLAKRFFYVCAGLLCLSLAYHLGARSATAQAGASVSGFATWNGVLYVLTPSGVVYWRQQSGTAMTPLVSLGNFWESPTPATRETWGGVKARYRQSAPAAPQDK